MRAVILAAGAGTRLRPRSGSIPKPLAPLHGVTLVERAIRCARTAGCTDIIVVTGYQGERVQAWLQKRAARVRCVWAANWSAGNGASLLAAAPLLGREPFLLLMADHVMEPSVVGRAVAAAAQHRRALDAGAALLIVDPRLEQVHDLPEATKVRLCDGRVTAIGKDVDPCDAADTGVFVGSMGLLRELEQIALEQISSERRASGSIHGEIVTLTGAAARLAGKGQLLGVPLDQGWWIDVDDAEAWRVAERRLLRAASTSDGDGPIARYLNRPLSRWITRMLAPTRLTPNGVTVGAFILSVGSAVSFASGQPQLGGLLCQAASVLDGSDGELARLRLEARPDGSLFDTVLDRYADAAVISGLIYAGLQQETWPAGLVLLAGLLALSGAPFSALLKDRLQLLSGVGTQKRYSPLRDDPGFLRWLPGNRDGRSLLICLLGLLGQPAWALAVLAAVTHALTLGRLWNGMRLLRQAKPTGVAPSATSSVTPGSGSETGPGRTDHSPA